MAGKKKSVARKIKEALKPRPIAPVELKDKKDEPPVVSKPFYPAEIAVGDSFKYKDRTWSVLSVGATRVVAKTTDAGPGLMEKIEKGDL